MAGDQPLLIDVHTHMYPPRYLEVLKNRTAVPYVAQPPPMDISKPNDLPPPRLIILPTDDDQSIPPSQRGRPISSDYSSVERKKLFMKRHGISASVISLANPWLDFLDPKDAATTAKLINDDMEGLCADSHAAKDGAVLYHFATLPLSAPMPDLVASIEYVASLKYCRGIILGTSGLGKGLDDPELDPVWRALEQRGLLIFMHPHYGLPGEVFGPKASESGHVMPLALGFPMETTIAFTRMYLAGIFERFPGLRVLLAHAGGTLPFLAGRLESCVLHERAEGTRNRAPIWTVLKNNVWLDGVIYNELGVKAAVEAVGKDRVLWGTDHPFFPPLEEDGKGDTLGGEEWLSVKMNVDAARKAFAEDHAGAEGVLGVNAAKLLSLDF